MQRLKCVTTAGILFTLSFAASSQTPAPASASAPATPPAAAPAAPAALPTPAITGPLSGLPPAMFDAGPFGKIAVNGILDGQGMVTGNYVPGDNSTQAALSNGQIFIQKTDGVVSVLPAGRRLQYYRLLGCRFLATDKTVSNLYGPVPVGFLKLQAGKNTSYPDRRAADADRRRVHLHLREHEHLTRPVVEPGKRRQSGNPGESDHGQIHRLAELERRLLFQPLLVAERLLDVCQWAP